MNRMSLIRWWGGPMMAVAFALAVTAFVRADDKPKSDTGTVTGKVMDKDGKAVSGAKVRVTTPGTRRRDSGATTQPASASDAGNSTASKATTRPAIAEGTTDADGKFTLENVPPGDYSVQATLRGQGSGREKVTVKAGESASVEIHLQPTKPRKTT